MTKHASHVRFGAYGPTWYIYCSVQLPKYSVRDRDIIVDDEGYRYEVGQAEWGALAIG